MNKTSQSTASRVWEFIRTSRLEPVVLLHGIAGGLRATPFHQLIQDKICLQDFNEPREYCHYLSQSKSSPLKDKILAEVATFTTFKEFAILIPAIITAFFIGSWCDKFTNGKRYCLLSSSFCQLFEGFLFLLNSIFMNARESQFFIHHKVSFTGKDYILPFLVYLSFFYVYYFSRILRNLLFSPSIHIR